MKKILIGVLIILLAVLAYFAIFKGISIGDFTVLSVSDIQEENNNLDDAIANVQTLMYSNYATATENLETSVENLMAAKEEYLDLENISTEAEIKEATIQETYKLEYLWTRIGSHATEEGVTLKLDITTGDSGALKFTVNGSYIAIINFITAIEDDSELGFKIDNFQMTPGTDTDGRQATFEITNISIESELSSSDTVTTIDTTGTTEGE